jgi:hypothetical protein
VKLFHDPPTFNPDVIVVIGHGGPEDTVAALRLCELWCRLAFCHFVVMTELAAHAAKCSAAAVNARPLPF